MKLQGKVALVTGADSGIGQATAELFAQEGADVCIAYHTDQSGAEETKRRVEAAGRRALVVQCDVGDPAAVAAMFEQAQGLGTLDILVNNAGKGMGGMPVADMEDAKLELILRTDLMGPLFCARAFIRLRRAHGGRGRSRDGQLGRAAPADAWQRPLWHGEGWGRIADPQPGAGTGGGPDQREQRGTGPDPDADDAGNAGRPEKGGGVDAGDPVAPAGTAGGDRTGGAVPRVR